VSYARSDPSPYDENSALPIVTGRFRVPDLSQRRRRSAAENYADKSQKELACF
jgi:hypothetical protein